LRHGHVKRFILQGATSSTRYDKQYKV
jgi:hypothetical protein